MSDTDPIRRQAARLLATQKLAVLATHGAGQPYGSLVSIAVTDDLRHVLFATTRSTRKFENLRADPRVALVVDNRQNTEADLHRAMALTLTGRAEEIPPEDRDAGLRLYLERHPYLKDFVTSPTCALVRVRVQSLYLVQRFQEVSVLHMPEEQ